MARHKRRTIQEHGPHPVDVYVGSRLRLRRAMLGMTQMKLAEAVGLTFQQVQKYEKGSNRIGASRLHEIAGVLGIPVSYFFEALEGGERGDVSTKRETLELVRAYYGIKSAGVRKRVYKLIKAAAKAED